MDLVDVLQSEFQKRQTKNARYSLRAFAQHLGVQSATLSAVLKRKRQLPTAKSLKIVNELKLSSTEKKKLIKNLKAPLGQATLNQFWSRPQLSIEAATLAVISEWEYFAVLSLCKLSDFKGQPKWIAKRLGLTLARAEEVWNTLINLKLLEFDGQNRVKVCFENLRVSTPVPSKVLRQGHHDELKLAQKKLDAVPMQQRNFSSLTFAMSSKKMNEANDLIRKFIQQMENTFEKGTMDQVYQLGIQLYPLTESEKVLNA